MMLCIKAKKEGDFLYSLGVDIGGTKCAVVLGKGELSGDIDSFIIDKIKFPTDVKRGWQMIVAEIIEKTEDLSSSRLPRKVKIFLLNELANTKRLLVSSHTELSVA